MYHGYESVNNTRHVCTRYKIMFLRFISVVVSRRKSCARSHLVIHDMWPNLIDTGPLLVMSLQMMPNAAYPANITGSPAIKEPSSFPRVHYTNVFAAPGRGKKKKKKPKQSKVTLHVCFILPNGSARTSPQSVPLSASSSTSPHTATLSPRMMYSPWLTLSLSLVECRGWKRRSIVDERMMLVVWSQPISLPVRCRPSEVRIVTVLPTNGIRDDII